MKKIITIITLVFALTLLLFSIGSTIAGITLMITNIESPDKFMNGFIFFSGGIILFFILELNHMTSNTKKNTEALIEAFTKFIEYTINRDSFEDKNIIPIPEAGTIHMSTIDENGNLTPFIEKKFNNHEEFIKHRNEIISKAFGTKPDDAIKKIEEMSLEELKIEEKKAVDTQNFELAACIRDAINEKDKK